MSRGIITFDCYGTLIDWENGIRKVFDQFVPNRPDMSQRIFDYYDEKERRIEQLDYRPYSRVMTEAMFAAMKRAGVDHISKTDLEDVAKSIPTWKPFPDTGRSLRQLSEKYDLGILSNIDNDLLHGTMKHFPVDFQLVITAEDVKSYKPAPAHFNKAREKIGSRKWLHVAGSLYHDIQPTYKLGIDSIWVNRKHVKPSLTSANSVKRKVTDLDELTRILT